MKLSERWARWLCRHDHHDTETTPDTHKIPLDYHGPFMTTTTTRCIRPWCGFSKPGNSTARGTVA